MFLLIFSVIRRHVRILRDLLLGSEKSNGFSPQTLISKQCMTVGCMEDYHMNSPQGVVLGSDQLSARSSTLFNIASILK